MNPKKLLFLCTILISSCDISYFENDIELKWDGDIKMPIGKINYTLSDLLQELDVNDINENSEGNLSLNYIESISEDENTTFNVVIEDISTSVEIKSPLTPAIFDAAGVSSPHTISVAEIAPGVPNPLIRTEKLSEQEVYKLELSRDLDGASFNGGELTLNIVSTFSIDVNMTIKIPSLTTKSGNATYQTTQIVKDTETQLKIPLENYNIDFTHNGVNFDQATNNIIINFVAEFDFKLGDTVKDNDKISLLANLTDAKTEVIYGDFKQESFSFSSESLFLDFFNHFGQGNVRFANPKMKISASNGYGVPIGINLSKIRAKNNTSSLSLKYDGDQNQEDIMIFDGIKTYSSSADSKITERIIDNTNSNFSDLLSLKPKEIELDIIGNANPINSFPNSNFYAPINNGFEAKIEIEIPLEVKFENIILTESIEFNNEEDNEYVENFILVLNTENSIPLSGRLEVIFLNEDIELNVSKSFVAFDAADIDSNGKSNGYKSTSTEIAFSENDLEKIKTATTIDVKCTLNSPEDKNEVTLLGTNDIVVKVATKSKVKF
jgi:hypothetical protein